MNANSEQLSIQNWFDSNYKLRGFGYLRPPEAYLLYNHLLHLKPNTDFLDVACGPGVMLKTAAQAGVNAYGIDISEVAISMSKTYVPEAKTFSCNAEDLPFEDGKFKYITCLGSLERMIDLKSVLAEQMRVTSADAHFCYLVRNSNTFMWQFFKRFLGMRNKRGHQGAKSMEEWIGIFNNSGFKIEQVIPDQWPRQRWKYHLLRSRNPYHFLKIKKGLLPLKYANEFIFVLSKNSA